MGTFGIIIAIIIVFIICAVSIFFIARNKKSVINKTDVSPDKEEANSSISEKELDNIIKNVNESQINAMDESSEQNDDY